MYFAGVKDITQKEVEEIGLQNDQWSLNDLSQMLIKNYGSKMRDLLHISMFALDMEYVEKEKESITILKPDSEIAIIPPVSGG